MPLTERVDLSPDELWGALVQLQQDALGRQAAEARRVAAL